MVILICKLPSIGTCICNMVCKLPSIGTCTCNMVCKLPSIAIEGSFHTVITILNVYVHLLRLVSILYYIYMYTYYHYQITYICISIEDSPIPLLTYYMYLLRVASIPLLPYYMYMYIYLLRFVSNVDSFS